MPKSAHLHRISIGLVTLSAASLAFEINLARLFSVSQFYHFAFLIVSIALFGYGASGSFLTLVPLHTRASPEKWLGRFAVLSGISILFAYIVVNNIPFDSYSVFIDPKQSIILILHYLLLSAPFFFSGASTGLLLSIYPAHTGRVYAASMIGSGIGCLVAITAPSIIGLPNTFLFCTLICSIAAIVWVAQKRNGRHEQSVNSETSLWTYTLPTFVGSLLMIGLSILLVFTPVNGLLDIHVSPYKSLSYTLLFPGAHIESQEWNSYSRVDVVKSDGIRSLPGISTSYSQIPPGELGLFVDADNLSPIVVDMNMADQFVPFLPISVGFTLRPDAETVILEPGGGLDIITALQMGSSRITAVEGNPLVVQAAKDVYQLPGVEVAQLAGRSFMGKAERKYDIAIISLVNGFHPVHSGDYSLSEEYRYTIEAFNDTFKVLKQDGILIASRWLQNPPSESLRAFATIVTALEDNGIEPDPNIVAIRGYNQATIFAKQEPFTQNELDLLFNFVENQNFDLIYSPIIKPELINNNNILQEPIYWDTFREFIATESRRDFYQEYPYNIQPTTDNRPFFGDYFKPQQLEQVLIEIGKSWLPFGGAGILVIVFVLGISLVLSTLLILVPVRLSNLRISPADEKNKKWQRARIYLLAYFAMLGLAYLFVEIPLIQYFIVYLDHPAYAFTIVLFSILSFSGVGSLFSNRIKLNIIFPLLILYTIGLPILLPAIIDKTISSHLVIRMLLTIVFLAPLGFFMGIPFPAGIQKIHQDIKIDLLVPWSWGVNGSASVISAILAALLALTLGYTAVIYIGAVAYTGAWMSMAIVSHLHPHAHYLSEAQT